MGEFGQHPLMCSICRSHFSQLLLSLLLGRLLPLPVEVEVEAVEVDEDECHHAQDAAVEEGALGAWAAVGASPAAHRTGTRQLETTSSVRQGKGNRMELLPSLFCLVLPARSGFGCSGMASPSSFWRGCGSGSVQRPPGEEGWPSWPWWPGPPAAET